MGGWLHMEALYQLLKKRYLLLQKPKGEWEQTLAAVISGIVWVDKRWL